MKTGAKYSYYTETNEEKNTFWIESIFDIARYFDGNVFHPITKTPLFKKNRYRIIWNKLDIIIKEQLFYLWENDKYYFSNFNKINKQRRTIVKNLQSVRDILTCLINQFKGEIREESKIDKILYENYITTLEYCLGLSKTVEKIQWKDSTQELPSNDSIVEVFCPKRKAIFLKTGNEVRCNTFTSPYWRESITLPIEKEQVIQPYSIDDCFPTD